LIYNNTFGGLVIEVENTTAGELTVGPPNDVMKILTTVMRNIPTMT